MIGLSPFTTSETGERGEAVGGVSSLRYSISIYGAEDDSIPYIVELLLVYIKSPFPTKPFITLVEFDKSISIVWPVSTPSMNLKEFLSSADACENP